MSTYLQFVRFQLVRFQKMIPKISCFAALLGLMAIVSPLSLAQGRGDIVRIGDSPRDQNYYQSYWQNLIDKERLIPRKAQPTPADSAPTTSARSSAQTILKNLKVRDLRLTYSGVPNRRFRQNVTTRFFPDIHSDQPGYIPAESYSSIHSIYWRPYLPDNYVGLIAGTLTNLNDFPVTVLGVNFKIVDAFGDLIQTGTVYPEPSAVASRQSVTFQKPLYSLSLRKRYEVKLLDPAFILSR
jgi:hypothetical protein